MLGRSNEQTSIARRKLAPKIGLIAFVFAIERTRPTSRACSRKDSSDPARTGTRNERRGLLAIVWPSERRLAAKAIPADPNAQRGPAVTVAIRERHEERASNALRSIIRRYALDGTIKVDGRKNDHSFAVSRRAAPSYLTDRQRAVITRQSAMNCRAMRQRIRRWLVTALRPQTMFHKPSERAVATARSANGTATRTGRCASVPSPANIAPATASAPLSRNRD